MYTELVDKKITISLLVEEKQYPRWQKTTLQKALKTRRVLLLSGPRQCGKTTLAKTLLSNAPYNAPATILDRISPNGTNILDTKQSYATGATTNGMASLGANTVTLSEAETPLKSHSHGSTGLSVTINDTGLLINLTVYSFLS